MGQQLGMFVLLLECLSHLSMQAWEGLGDPATIAIKELSLAEWTFNWLIQCTREPICCEAGQVYTLNSPSPKLSTKVELNAHSVQWDQLSGPHNLFYFLIWAYLICVIFIRPFFWIVMCHVNTPVYYWEENIESKSK